MGPRHLHAANAWCERLLDWQMIMALVFGRNLCELKGRQGLMIMTVEWFEFGDQIESVHLPKTRKT
jgi:hypothetical protein